MTRIIRFGVALAMAVAGMTIGAQAQEQEAKPAAVQQQKTQVPLKLQIVLSRYQGEKKISSVPYQVWLTTAESLGSAVTRLRMGLQVPVPTTTFGAVGAGGVNTVPISSYTLKDVGTNIDCSATPGVEAGVYRISMTIADSAVTTSKVGDSSTATPTFRNFSTTVNILLRDGQTGQVTSATDPVNGEVLKIDVTLNVLK